MSTSNHHHTSSTILPPISVFTSRSPLPPPPTNHASSSLMPASPPTGYDKNFKSLPILPKPQGELYQEHTAPRSDQSALWALFNEFQKQQQQNNAYQTKEHGTSLNRRDSDSNNHALMLSSEEVLAEKRRRNAGASARFRDRRKQRERELQDKCHELELRSKGFEMALRHLEPDHPLLVKASVTSQSSSPVQYASTDYQNSSDQNTLFDRVGQLEHMMTRFRKEKETDAQKLDELEKENKYLRSLLVPVNLTTTPKTTDSGGSKNSSPYTFATDEDQRSSHNRHHPSFDEDDSSMSSRKRIHLSPSHNEVSADDTHRQ